MKLIISVLLILTVTAAVHSTGYQIILQEQIDGMENASDVDPILSSGGELEGFVSTGDTVRLFTFSDGYIALQSIMAGSTVANWRSDDNDTLYLYLSTMRYLKRYSLAAGPTVFDSEFVDMHQPIGFTSTYSHDLAVSTDQDSGQDQVRLCRIFRYYFWNFPEYEEREWSNTTLFTLDLSASIASIPAHFVCSADLSNHNDSLLTSYRFIQDDYVRLWTELVIKHSGGEVLRIEHDNRIYRSVFAGNFCNQLPSDEIVAEYFPARWTDSDWWMRDDFILEVLNFQIDSLYVIWSQPVGDLIIQWSDPANGMVVGTAGRQSGPLDSLVVFVDVEAGQLSDTINLDRAVRPYRFFESDGGTLNLICRAHDTIFVYQFDTPLGIEEPTTEPTRPTDFVLHQNYPNPFNPETSISYNLNRRQQVCLTVFNVLGQEVAVLHDGVQSKGTHELRWNGLDNNGDYVASGVYFAKLRGEAHSSTIKMMLVR